MTGGSEGKQRSRLRTCRGSEDGEKVGGPSEGGEEGVGSEGDAVWGEGNGDPKRLGVSE